MKTTHPEPRETARVFDDNRLLPILFGEHHQHLSELESALGVSILAHGNEVKIRGSDEARAVTAKVLDDLYARILRGQIIDSGDVVGAARLAIAAPKSEAMLPPGDPAYHVRTWRKVVAPRTPTQARYIEAIRSNDLVFGLGPAGTGKTYLAVAVAVSLLYQGQVERIVLSRPAVEAGERLGFLPGDMREKVDPYLQPLYDALHDMMPGEQVRRRLDSGEIEVAPLAFMRGRTLSSAFVILDEAQNASPMQMKMFLTRLGPKSRMVVTGDPSQSDLPGAAPSGLREAETILKGVSGLAFVRFDESDIVRHPLVSRIVKAYNAHDKSKGA
jgi:phosphate starvation-inducible PhoH-like protein